MSSGVTKAAQWHQERGVGAGLGEGRWRLRPVPAERGGGTHFSLGKLFAYQLTSGKEKNMRQAICSQRSAGAGPGASQRSGSQTQFQNPRQLPPGLFWEEAQLGGTPAFEAFPGARAEAVRTPSRACQLPPRPGRRPAPATRNTLLPTSEAASAGVGFLGKEEGDWETQGGALWPEGLAAPSSLLGGSHSLPPSTRTPRRLPHPRAHPSSTGPSRLKGGGGAPPSCERAPGGRASQAG